jgi:hypothetical protein
MANNALAHGGLVRGHGAFRKGVVIAGVALSTVLTLGALVLSLAFLVGTQSTPLASGAVIALGAALLSQGIAIVGQLRLRGRTLASGVEPETAEVGVEAFIGVVAITLGVLALAGQGSVAHLLPISSIILGVGLVFGQCPLAEVTSGDERVTSDGGTPKTTYRIAITASAIHAFVGMGAIVLGIVGLTVAGLLALPVIAFLAISVTLLAGCTALAARLVRHH